MQKKYNTGLSIYEYYKRSKEGKLEAPARQEGYEGDGKYYRNAVDENGVTRRIEVPRESAKGRKVKKGEPMSISHLPDQLVPYNKYPEDLISRSVCIRIKSRTDEEALDEISSIYDKRNEKTAEENKGDGMDSSEMVHTLYELGATQIKKFKEIVKDAWQKYIVWMKKSRHEYPLEVFVKMCAQNNFTRVFVISEKYYESNGGRFLFGTASQFRNKPYPQ